MWHVRICRALCIPTQTHQLKGNEHIVHLTASAHQMFNEIHWISFSQTVFVSLIQNDSFYGGSHISVLPSTWFPLKEWTEIHWSSLQLKEKCIVVIAIGALLNCSLISIGQQVSFFLNETRRWGCAELTIIKPFCITFLIRYTLLFGCDFLTSGFFMACLFSKQNQFFSRNFVAIPFISVIYCWNPPASHMCANLRL